MHTKMMTINTESPSFIQVTCFFFFFIKSVYLLIYLFIHLFIHLFLHLSIHLFIHFFLHFLFLHFLFDIYLLILSTCNHFYLSIYFMHILILSIYLYVCKVVFH